jgi:hypothetical protein
MNNKLKCRNNTFGFTRAVKTTLKLHYDIILFCTLIVATSCKKDKIKTPEDYRVTVGNQSFGAYLNGQPWVPDYRDVGNGVEPIEIKLVLRGTPGSYTRSLWVIARKSNDQLNLYIQTVTGVGRVYFDKNTQPYPFELYPQPYGIYELYTPLKRFITNLDFTGYIDIIKFNDYLGQLEATFEFTAKSQTSIETITITKGYLKRNL